MLALCPEAVDMERASQKSWYTRDARDATAELGVKGRDLILPDMRGVLGRRQEIGPSSRNRWGYGLRPALYSSKIFSRRQSCVPGVMVAAAPAAMPSLKASSGSFPSDMAQTIAPRKLSPAPTADRTLTWVAGNLENSGRTCQQGAVRAQCHGNKFRRTARNQVRGRLTNAVFIELPSRQLF